MKNLMKLFTLMSVSTVLTATASAQGATVVLSSVTPWETCTQNGIVGYLVYTYWIGAQGKCSDNTLIGVQVREQVVCTAATASREKLTLGPLVSCRLRLCTQ